MSWQTLVLILGLFVELIAIIAVNNWFEVQKMRIQQIDDHRNEKRNNES